MFWPAKKNESLINNLFRALKSTVKKPATMEPLFYYNVPIQSHFGRVKDEPNFLLTGEMVIGPISIRTAFTRTRYEARDSSPFFSPPIISAEAWRRDKRREEVTRMIKSRNNFNVVSLKSRFIPVLFLRLQMFHRWKKEEWTGGWGPENHLVIFLSYSVVKVKCGLRSGASN